MSKPVAIIGIPTSAGAFAPGQEQAPQALRDAGLIEKLKQAGVQVVDHGDGPIWRWRPDRANRFAQNLEAVVNIAQETATRVQHALGQGQLPLVIGGDCTIELGVVAGHLPTEERIGLIYFDLHPDLNVPDSTRSGALDWMGMAHLLGEEKGVAQLSRLGPRFPLLTADDVFFFAYGPHNRTAWEHEVMERRQLRGAPLEVVGSDPAGAAARSLAEFGAKFDHILIHFDVDTIDFTDMPLSENTGRNEGLSFEQARRALAVLTSSQKLSALTITELNPNHGAEDGSTLKLFVEALVKALSDSPAVAKG